MNVSPNYQSINLAMKSVSTYEENDNFDYRDDNRQKLEEMLKSEKISQKTFDCVIACRKEIERKYKRVNRIKVEWEAIKLKIECLPYSSEQKKELFSLIEDRIRNNIRGKREKLSINNYISVNLIGKGAFGEVHVCIHRKTKEVFAIKKIKKSYVIEKKQTLHTRDEQDFLCQINSPWIVELKESFQDADNLYLVMEFMQGGDLMGLLIKRDILEENEAKFYMAELVLAIDELHKYGCVHRDIKPDNLLIDKNGHIKISDFGLAKISNNIFNVDTFGYKYDINDPNDHSKYSHKQLKSCVGTAFYVAPEVLEKNGYDQCVDWWSAGVILFEMLYGYSPFSSSKTADACKKVLNYKEYLVFPKKIKVSEEAKDLMKRLISNSDNRLGANGVDEIKSHKFFLGFNWKNIRKMTPPFVPTLDNEYDTRYFDVRKKTEPFIKISINEKQKPIDPQFIGYNFSRNIINNPTDLEEVQKIITEKIKEFEMEKNNNNNENKNKNKDKNADGGSYDLDKVATSPDSDGLNYSENKKVNVNSNQGNSNKKDYETKNDIEQNTYEEKEKINAIKIENNNSNNCTNSHISNNKVDLMKTFNIAKKIDAKESSKIIQNLKTNSGKKSSNLHINKNSKNIPINNINVIHNISKNENCNSNNNNTTTAAVNTVEIINNSNYYTNPNTCRTLETERIKGNKMFNTNEVLCRKNKENKIGIFGRIKRSLSKAIKKI